MQPADYAALIRHVDACVARDRLDEAEPALHRIVALNPREHFGWCLLGLAALRRGEPEVAVSHFQRALALDRNNAAYMNHLGVAYGELGRFDDALAALRKSVRANPANVEAHFNIGKVQGKCDDLRGAREAFRRAAALDPRYPGARFMYAGVLCRLGDFQAARRVLGEVLADDPTDERSIALLGHVEAALHGHAAAIEVYRDAARRLPGSGMLARALGQALLAAGAFRAGWEAYARRDCPGPAPRPELPAQLPDDLTGQTLVLRPEQGLGDVLFFLRFAGTAEARGAKLVVVAWRKLVPLLARVRVFADVVPDGASVSSAAGLPLSVADLPFALRAEDTPPALALAPLPERVTAWRERLALFGPPPYVGVTWRAGTDFRRRTEFGANLQVLFKEVPAAPLAAMLRRAPGTLVSLQRQPDPGEVHAFAAAAGRPVFDAAAANDDLEDALGLLAVLDEYVGVSNTNFHLRAGLGRPARVLVPYPPEWRWMAEGDRSPWFPEVAVYRQRADGSLEDAFARLSAALAA